ncbi:MAG: AMP-binding protein [Thermodesulfobacteriota bacterium]|nr:AMP-binding protein [Thermodesulfobacteriota bacterium]
MMVGLWGDRSRYDGHFQNNWFLTGDIGLQDEEGCFYHQGRLDDILKTSLFYTAFSMSTKTIKI